LTENSKKQPNLPALLEYYSDSGIAHVTIFVAFMFGIFTVLVILDRFENIVWSFWLLSFVYWVLFGGGLYTLLKFSYYSKISNRILYDLGKDEKICFLAKDKNDRRNEDEYISYAEYPYRSKEINLFFRVIYHVLSKGKVLPFAMFLYFLIGLFSYLAIMLT